MRGLWLILVGLLCAVGLGACLAGRDAADDEDGFWLDPEASSQQQLGSRDYAVIPAEADLELCRALAAKQRQCEEDQPEAQPLDGSACASRYACSRRLWRADVAAEVYRCISQRPCDDPDPTTTCLGQAAKPLPITPAQREFDAVLAAADDECPGLLEVAPGQSDTVYQALTPCLTSYRSCDERADCAARRLSELVDEICDDTQGSSPALTQTGGA